LGADYYYNIKRKDNVVSKKVDFNSEAILKDFSTYIKQEMIDHAIDHKQDFEDELDFVLKRINQLTEEELLALYIKYQEFRSEERRVGKECRYGWEAQHCRDESTGKR